MNYPDLEELQQILSLDKRKCERLSLALTIFYVTGIIKDPASQKDWIGPIASDNISGSGLRFTSDERLAKRQDLSLKILMAEDKDPIYVSGIVVWCKRDTNNLSSKSKQRQDLYSVGVELHHMNQADRKRFVIFVCENILSKYLNRKGKLKVRWVKPKNSPPSPKNK